MYIDFYIGQSSLIHTIRPLGHIYMYTRLLSIDIFAWYRVKDEAGSTHIGAAILAQALAFAYGNCVSCVDQSHCFLACCCVVQLLGQAIKGLYLHKVSSGIETRARKLCINIFLWFEFQLVKEFGFDCFIKDTTPHQTAGGWTCGTESALVTVTIRCW